MEPLLYWHWIVLGVVLMLLEIVIPSFTVLWFGMGAVLVGFISLLMPLSLVVQILLWTVFSAIATFIWFKFLKPRSFTHSASGIKAEQVVGEIGHIIIQPEPNRTGRLRFSVPVHGEEEWPCESEQSIALGDRVKVCGIVGDNLLVEKV